MSDPVLWPLDDHTRAKHRVLRAYLDAWIPVMGQQALKVRPAGAQPPRLLLVDGFAGPGRYETGEPGSPLIMLDALASHKAFSKFSAVQFIYLFIEKDRRRVSYLESELAKLTMPVNARVRVEQDEFETTFHRILDEAPGDDYSLVPTFAFIDPFGYSQASMALTGRLLDFPRSETLFFLPLTHIARFVGRAGQERALDVLFDTDRWREAIPLNGDERRSFLLSLFERQLEQWGQIRHVRSFTLRTRDRNDYRLVFATGHERGLAMMKRAMWSVDPEKGTRYTALTQSGQEVLFQSTVDTKALIAELRDVFGKDWFTVAQAEQVTLLRTPYMHDSHLKTLTLRPAEKAGELMVKRPGSRRAGTFTDDAQMRFR